VEVSRAAVSGFYVQGSKEQEGEAGAGQAAVEESLACEVWGEGVSGEAYAGFYV